MEGIIQYGHQKSVAVCQCHILLRGRGKYPKDNITQQTTPYAKDAAVVRNHLFLEIFHVS